ncbi:YbaB/EbfC family DNA-binding protein [Mycobacterium sp. NPDC003449]
MGDMPPFDPDDADDHDSLAALDFVYAPAGAEPAEDQPGVPLFSVTNPPETVTVSAYMDGRVHRIELAPKAVDMTERDLADEIVLIADLAGQQGRSAQHSLMLEGMREYGHDDLATRDFLTRELNLPTPEQAEDARAQVFSTRYGGDHG